jgi:uncharacterized repeat protein (TIGR01451 family)
MAETPCESASSAGEHGVLRLRESSASRSFHFAQNDNFLEKAAQGKAAAGERTESALFEALARDLLKAGNSVRFQARGASMSPAIRDGEIVHVTPVIMAKLRIGHILLIKGVNGFRVHRLVAADPDENSFITRGDCGLEDDPPVGREQILGIAEAKEVRIGRRIVRAKFSGVSGHMLRGVARGQVVLSKASGVLSALALLFVLFGATTLRAQVAVDATTSGSATLSNIANTITFAHTTTATVNRVMIVGVSINITNNSAAAVTGITYNGTALTLVGAHNDAGNTRRVELWYLLAPTNGNHNVIVSVNIPTAVNEGVVAGATTFTGVDQTVPLGTFVSGDGANAGNSQLDVPSVINGMILDTLATDGTQTITVPGPQVQQWAVRSNNNTNPGIRGVGTSRTGAPSVPISETFSGTSNWVEAAVSVNPTAADIGVSTSVGSAVFLGQNSVYTITVKNNGPSAANGVTLTDTLAAGPTFVSAVASAGTTCTGTGPVTCTLPTPLASGATATVTVTVTAVASGSYSNTATVTDAGTPPDPNTGNNTYTSVATVQAVACATVAQATAGTPMGVVNTYYPGTASVAAGATSITIGAATGTGTAITSGSLLLVIQMQDASINDSNTVAYGNGSTGQGFTALNSAGNYEFVTATSAVGTGGGTLSIAGAGSGGGLVFAYNNAAFSATKGQSKFQVILVPQYTTATLSAATPPMALGWNGSTGGVLVMDTSSTLTLNGAVVSVDGMGFRGAAGLQLQGGVGGNNTDYLHAAPATYTGVVENGVDASKGEGIAGTPFWVESAGTYANGNSSYPSGTAGVDASNARGAPGNAGGGGTDGDAGGNTENAGGGGGGNGGAGGFGGNSWNVNLSSGGEGGAAFPATINRVALGGGGGAGSRNNSDGDTLASSGSAGGGIIIIRAYALSGTATLTANGAAAYNGTSNDAGGGAGAGGSIVVLSANGGEGGLTLQANGGRGGDAWDTDPYSLGDRHGPGGGGGGGTVFVSGAPASISIGGGASGTTLNPGVPYGATAGASGTSVTNASITSTSGTQSGAQCTPDMTLGKSHVGNFTRGLSASYTIPVSNLSPYGPSSGTVTINDTLPTGMTPTSATGTGWTCSITAQTVSCVRSDAVAANSSYPSITVNATVSQAAPATITNTATVGGGGEVNLVNDTATDVANVGSSADLSVTDAGSPNPVAAGGNITYTQVVTNNGPSAADNATYVAAVPANTTFVSIAAPAGWSCLGPAVGSTGNEVCTNSNMAASTAATFTLVVKVNAGTANGTIISDSVSASSSASDPNSSNNTASVNTVVGTTAPDLTVSNVASPNPVQAGNNITYTQVVTNTGATAATSATFTGSAPANTTFVSITPPAGWSCLTPPPVACSDPSVAAGASGTFTLVYKVNAGTASGTVIVDTATVNASNQAFGSNSASASDVVGTATQADLALSTAATPSTVFAGNDITYTQTVTNNGPAAATGASFTEAIPTNTTFASVSAPVGWTCTVTTSVTCTDPSLAAGSSTDIFVVVNVAPSVVAASITAASSVTATTSDPNSANNSTSVVTAVSVACDLTVTNSGTPSPVTAGNNITYTQTIYNNGPSNCSTATLQEATPANTTFVSAAVVTSGGGTWTCPNSAPISCTNPSVPPGSTGTLTAIYKVNAGTVAGTIITDTDTGATTSRDTNLADNSATVNIAVASATQADLGVTNSGSPNPVTAGNNITYTQTVNNAGPAAASTVVFSETLPANTTFVSLSGPAGWSCTATVPYQCTIATLASGGTGSFSFVVKVNSTVASGTTITDTDTVSSATSDPNGGNNSASTNVVVADSADLSVTNSASPVPVQAGNNITYTQVVTNAGPSTATTASFTESTPPNTTFVSLTPVPGGWSCTLPTVGSAGTITCTNPSFAPGTASFPVVLKVTAGTVAGTAINDTATISSVTSDPNSANNSATAADVVALGTQADLVTTNSASPALVAAGSNLTYTQSVTNDGPAAATTASFTQTTPPNTNFQSITPPAGWTCGTLPPIGGTGTITCTDPSLAVNAIANFTLVLQVNAGTPSGTNISETDTATATNIVPGLTTNSATATAIVANANSADVAIVKTATPNPVLEGDPLTYSLAVANNGPASATNVTVIDTLPSSVTFLQTTTTQGSCSEAGGTVTCLLGTMANAGTATITVLTIPGTPGVITNTATVMADQTDPNLSNNTSTWAETVTASTRVTLQSFSAHSGADKNGVPRVFLTWKTGGEAHNLGFNVYREENGSRVRLNPSIIAGSALWMSGALPKHSAKSYAWIDNSPSAFAGSYWLEDIDVNGTRTLHGPVTVQSGAPSESEASAAETRTFRQLSQAQPAALSSQQSHVTETFPRDLTASGGPSSAQVQKQFQLAAHQAVKIFVRHEGWYRVTQPDLVAAGLNPNVDPSQLHLFAEANEQPIQITGATAGPGGFGPQAALQFYGTAIDTVFSGTRVYWLVASDGHGLRIPREAPGVGSNQPPANFPATVELRQHTIYFAALLTPNGDNFFGAFVSTTPVDQALVVPYLDTTSTEQPTLEIALQGVINGIPHDVLVQLNGTTLGDVTFTGQATGKLTFNIPPGVLLDWNNTVTLTSQNGEYDSSLVDHIRITYPHLYTADQDALKFTGRPGEQLTVGGFKDSAITVLDITDPNSPVQLTTQKASGSGDYSVKLQVPWTTTYGKAPARHTLLALASDAIATAAAVRPNHPSSWHSAQAGADIAMVTYEDFAAALAPLIQAHQAEGKSSSVIPINDLYDEFNFGERSPFVIRQLLKSAIANWTKPPSYLLLNGRASLDPRNYLGFGHLDLVPTRILASTNLMTSSDDWFSDFNGSGMPTIPTGRLPVGTLDDATTVVGKIVAYEGNSTNGAWTSQALMVADRDDTESFSQDTLDVQTQLPSTMQITDVLTSTVGTTAAKQDIIDGINAGQLLVNYLGHGAEEQWSGADIFDTTSVTTLTNGSQLPVFLIMDCLNGFFQDVYSQPLAVTLLLAPNGGAVAVVASSSLNSAVPQTKLDKLILQDALNAARPTLGESVLKAKSHIGDPGVRRTFILFGDPAMQMKSPTPNAAH